MKAFLAGVGTTLLVLVLALTAGVLTLGPPDDLPGPPAPTPPPSATAQAPTRMPAGRTWLGELDLTSSDLLSSTDRLTDVRLHGVAVTLSDKGIHAEQMGVDATLPYAVAAARVGAGTRLYAVPGGRVGVSRRLTVAGRDIEVRAVGRVRVAGGQLVVTPQRVDLGGPDWLDTAASEAARRWVTIRQRVDGIPRGMSLTSVQPVPTGFRVHLSGADVTLAP